MYRSNAEEQFAIYLTDTKIDFTYEEFKISYKVYRNYKPDFYFKKYNFFVEYKGYFKPADRRKHLLIKQQHPKLDIRFVFQNAANKLNKNSNTTYADWCDKHDFKWSQTEVPQRWLSKLKK